MLEVGIAVQIMEIPTQCSVYLYRLQDYDVRFYGLSVWAWIDQCYLLQCAALYYGKKVEVHCETHL